MDEKIRVVAGWSRSERPGPCKVCGCVTNRVTLVGTYRCGDCWDLEVHLPRYLLSTEGRELVKELLKIKRDDLERLVREATYTTSGD